MKPEQKLKARPSSAAASRRAADESELPTRVIRNPRAPSSQGTTKAAHWDRPRTLDVSQLASLLEPPEVSEKVAIPEPTLQIRSRPRSAALAPSSIVRERARPFAQQDELDRLAEQRKNRMFAGVLMAASTIALLAAFWWARHQNAKRPGLDPLTQAQPKSSGMRLSATRTIEVWEEPESTPATSTPR